MGIVPKDELMLERTHWSKLGNDDDGLIPLDRNENCDRLYSARLAEYFREHMTGNLLRRYPDIRKAYIDAAKYTGVDPSYLYLTSGSEQAIRSVLYMYSQVKSLDIRTRSIAFPNPTFGMVEVYARLFKYKVHTINYRFDGESFRINISDHISPDIDIIYVASPDNPTGVRIEDQEINKIIKKGRPVVIDQAYVDFDFRKATLEAYLHRHENLYIIRSFSKAGGVAGLRCGYVISHPKNIISLQEDRPMYELNSLACLFLSFLTKNPSELEDSTRRLLEGKDYLEKWLKSEGMDVIETRANFTLIRYDVNMLEFLSKYARVKVVDIDKRKFIRITAANLGTIKRMIAL